MANIISRPLCVKYRVYQYILKLKHISSTCKNRTTVKLLQYMGIKNIDMIKGFSIKTKKFHIVGNSLAVLMQTKDDMKHLKNSYVH